MAYEAELLRGRDGVGEPEPGVTPGVPAERSDLQMMSVSKTSQLGSAQRSGPVIVVLPVPLAPVTTNSGKPGTGCAMPHRGQ